MHNAIIRNRFYEEIQSEILSETDIEISGFDNSGLDFSSQTNLYINGILYYPTEYTSGSTTSTIKFNSLILNNNDKLILDTYSLRGTGSCDNLVLSREIYNFSITSSIAAGDDIEIFGFNNSNLNFESDLNVFVNGLLLNKINEFNSGSTTSSITITENLNTNDNLVLEIFNINSSSCALIENYTTKEKFIYEITSSLYSGNEFNISGLNNEYYNFLSETNLYVNGIYYKNDEYTSGSVLNSLIFHHDLYQYDLISFEAFKNVDIINFTGNLFGESDLQLDRLIIVKYIGLKEESEIDICISHNGNINSGSIFNSYTFVGSFDTYENITYVFNNKDSNALNFSLPINDINIEIYLNSYNQNRLFGKVTFDTLNYNGTFNIINNYNFVPGDKLLFVSDSTFNLNTNYNNLTFGINMNFGVCK